jgi:hypothetical protein
MSEKEHLIFFSSDFSSYDRNSGHFCVHLPNTLNLEGEWKCAVLDFFITPDNSPEHSSSQFIYILADFCETSIILQGGYKPILKKVHLSKGAHQYEFSYPLYIPLKQSRLTDFDLIFLDNFFLPIRINQSSRIECTLHFIKNE